MLLLFIREVKDHLIIDLWRQVKLIRLGGPEDVRRDQRVELINVPMRHDLTAILTAFLISFFPIVVNTVVGLKEVEPELLELARINRGSQFDVFKKIRLPNSLPYLFAGIKVAIDPLPTAGSEPAQPFIGVNGFFISSKSQNSLAANEFAVNYLTTEEVQDAMFAAGGRPPALKASFEKAASDPIVEAFGKNGQNGVPMPALPEMDAVWADWGGTELALIKGQGDPEEAWKTMVSNVEAKIGQ